MIMNTKNLNALYDLSDESDKALKALVAVIAQADRFDLPLAEEARDLYMRLRVVLGGIEEIAYSNDEQAQYEAN
jgi:hypothetical protein